MRILFAALALCATPALAEAPLQAMFPNLGTCYARIYNLAHLASHPDQRVTRISVVPEQEQWNGDGLVVDVRFRLRDNPEEYLGTAYCEAQGAHLYCGMEGDAGNFTLERAKGAVLLRVGPYGMGFEGGKDFQRLESDRGDDREFLMPKIATADCR